VIGVEVAALGDVESAVAPGVQQFVSRVFQMDSRLSATSFDPAELPDCRGHQVGSHELMARLQSCVPDDGWRLLSLVPQDLYLPMLSFVFGHAQLDGPVAIVSLARLQQEYYGLHPDPARFERRLHTEVAHELGHTMGLHHCADLTCCMSLSTSIDEVDAKNPDFCRSCRVRLREWRIGISRDSDLTRVRRQ
jgi:archaemetzincin